MPQETLKTDPRRRLERPVGSYFVCDSIVIRTFISNSPFHGEGYHIIGQSYVQVILLRRSVSLMEEESSPSFLPLISRLINNDVPSLCTLFLLNVWSLKSEEVYHRWIEINYVTPRRKRIKIFNIYIRQVKQDWITYLCWTLEYTFFRKFICLKRIKWILLFFFHVSYFFEIIYMSYIYV